MRPWIKQRQHSALSALLILAVAAVAVFFPPHARAADNGIQTLDISQVNGAILLRLGLRQPIGAAPGVFGTTNPPRLVFDFPRTDNNLGRSGQMVNLGDLYSLNVMQVGDRTRLVLNLKRTLPYETRPDGQSLLITLLPANAQAFYAQSGVSSFSRPTTDGQFGIRDINFRRGKEGNGLIAVDLSDPNVGIDIRKQGGSIEVDFTKTALPQRLRRKLDVTDFATPVTAINAQQVGPNVRLTITPSGLWEHNAYQSNNQFVIDVRKIVEDPNKLVQGTRGGYQGDKLSLNFQSIDVRSVLEVIADFTGLNIVVSDSVGGNLTLRLKDVPWDQALDIILNTRGLDMRKNGNVLWIAPRDELLIKEKQTLESRAQISDLEPLETESFQINYHTAGAVMAFLQSRSAAAEPKSGGSSAQSASSALLSTRGRVVSDERSNKLFVTDTAKYLASIRKLIAEIDVPARQVLIEARLVEASENWQRDLGARLGFVDKKPAQGNSVNATLGGDLSVPGYYTGQVATIPNYLTAGSGASGPSSLGVNLPVSGTSANPGVFSLVLYNKAMTNLLNLELSALESDGRGKTITSPRVLTADKMEALIEQGVQVPYLQASSSGATSISFQKANLSLRVKPSITPDGRVDMELDIAKDEPDWSRTVSGSVPINSKHVKTRALIDNGGTVVIGGIFTQTKSDTTYKVPVLGDLPGVGIFFRNNSKKDQRTELLMFITPKIVSDALAIR
jgi:type IV pilus assembly protein PilQ